MFSFVIYNIEMKKCFLARDRFGIKPLYYAELSCGIVFSSEIKSLIPHVNSANTIEKLAIACTSFVGTNILRQTVFKLCSCFFSSKNVVFGEIVKW